MADNQLQAPKQAAQDRQNKGAVGAGLVSGGAAILVATGVGALFGAFAAGFQIGYGGGMIAKSAAAERSRDPRYAEAVALASLEVSALPDTQSERVDLAQPANTIVARLGTAIVNLRGLRTALDRYHAASIVGDPISQRHRDSAVMFHEAARSSFLVVAESLRTLASGLRSHHAGAVSIEVRKVYGDFLRDLLRSGLPSSEDRYLDAFRLVSDERERLVNTFIRFSPDDAVRYFGERITFADLLAELGANARDIADIIALEVGLPGYVPTQGIQTPAAQTVSVTEFTEAAFNGVLRAIEARQSGTRILQGPTKVPPWGPITFGLIWHPTGSSPFPAPSQERTGD